MYSFDLQMSQIHALLAWCSVAFFVVRGLAFQLGARWALDSRLSILVFGINLLMTITGLSLWALQHYNPLQQDSWLLAKLLALLAFAACSHWALGQAEFRSVGYLLALLMLAYMMGVSITRNPWLGG